MEKKFLKSITCPCCKTKGKVRRDFDYPKSMRVCDNCFADFNTSGDITLDPSKYDVITGSGNSNRNP